MSKIIGFLISKENKKPKVDIFEVGLNIISIKHKNYNIFLWGIGDIDNYLIDYKYSLSFPLNDSLLDRNILISLNEDEIIIENDWLGSIPVFYNTKDQIVSTLSNLCLKDKTIHGEGLYLFCEFGYSVFEQTIFRDVKFMRYYSKLIISEDIKVAHKNDPVLEDSFLENSNEEIVLDLMQDYLSNIESKTTGDILLPTSGGYDSRILNYFIKDKTRIRAFTYGISKNQCKSSEVVYAKKISEIYKTKWEQIKLEKFHDYIDKWTEVYGYSTHLHGMYHIEFYSKILKKYSLYNTSFLSGIFGDVWAGNVKYKPIEKHQDILNLGYAHGLNLDLQYLKNNLQDTLKKEYFDKLQKHLENDKIKSVFTVRMKLMLISYLTQIPEYFGMPVWTPFLNFEIVKSTLNISEEKRKNRIWQRDFFKKVDLNLEDMNLKSIKNNKLDYEIAKHEIFELIDVEMMKRYIHERRLHEINTILSKLSPFEKVKNQLLYLRKVGRLLRMLGFRNEYLKALHEYYLIKAIEKGLKYDT